MGHLLCGVVRFQLCPHPSYTGVQKLNIDRCVASKKKKKTTQLNYSESIREVELAFVPLVLSTFGGMSGCTQVVYSCKRLASLFSLKKGIPY